MSSAEYFFFFFLWVRNIIIILQNSLMCTESSNFSYVGSFFIKFFKEIETE